METQIQIQEVKKQIGDFKAVFKAAYDSKKEDKIFLNITISEELRELIKFACSETNKEKVKINILEGLENLAEYKRYRVKDWLYNCLYSDYRDLLFMTGLVDNGTILIPFDSLSSLESAVNYLRDSIQRLVKEIIRSKGFNMVVTFTIKEDE